MNNSRAAANPRRNRLESQSFEAETLSTNGPGMSLKNFADLTEREVLAMDTPLLKAAAQIVVGGVVVLAVGALIGGA
jgi:hypothetical protein